jgi:hypothetical protein
MRTIKQLYGYNISCTFFSHRRNFEKMDRNGKKFVKKFHSEINAFSSICFRFIVFAGRYTCLDISTNCFFNPKMPEIHLNSDLWTLSVSPSWICNNVMRSATSAQWQNLFSLYHSSITGSNRNKQTNKILSLLKCKKYCTQLQSMAKRGRCWCVLHYCHHCHSPHHTEL